MFITLNKIIFKDQRTFEKLVFLLYRRFKKWASFEVNRDFDWFVRTTGLSEDSYRISNKLSRTFSRFEKFSIVWILSNYCALKSIELKRGLFLCYEELQEHEEQSIADFQTYLGIKKFPCRIDFTAKYYERPTRSLRLRFLKLQIDMVLEAN